MNESETERILRLREHLGHPTTEEESVAMNSLLPAFRQEVMVTFSNKGQAFSLFDHVRKQNRQLSRPRLCAETILTFPIFPFIWEAERQRNDPMIRFFYDFGTGVFSSASLIMLAEEQLVGSDATIAQQMKYSLGAAITPGDRYTILTTQSSDAAEILKQDQTGISLVERNLDVMRTSGTWDIPWQSRGYVTVGAEVARDAYKFLYDFSGIYRGGI